MPRNPLLLLATSLALLLAGPGCTGSSGCRVNLDCPSGELCSAGSCQQSTIKACSGDSDCPSGEACIAAACQPDCTTQGCPQGELCDSASHRCLVRVYAGADGGGTGGSTTGGNTGGTTTGGTTGATIPYCQSCAGTSCGNPKNFCMQDARGFSFCGQDCSAGQPCPDGASCTTITDPNTGSFLGMNCTPNTFLCWCAQKNDTWANYANDFMQNNCQYCHVSHPQNTQFTSYANVSNNAAAIEYQIGTALMPLGTTLSASDQTRILNWFECGLAQ